MKKEPYLRRSSVSSGNYVISGKKGEILDAYLGSCVGLTLCDKHSDVGGLIHLLLPEPPGRDMFGKPENYALTGLPMFIRDLRDTGGR
ncbi:hypothetical protein ACFL7M_04690 [Thermodesulfobacteriota bacterium]